MGGGTLFYIKGSGYDMTSDNNQVFIGNDKAKVIGTLSDIKGYLKDILPLKRSQFCLFDVRICSTGDPRQISYQGGGLQSENSDAEGGCVLG